MQGILDHVPLAPYTTFKIGGPAKYFVDVTSEDDIRDAISWAHSNNIAFVILSGGSNVLIPDVGLEKLVIHITGGYVSFAETEVSADAGCNLLDVIRAASKKGLGGWEKLAGIPGSIGGAARGNAGAFGSEIKDFVHKITAINMNSGAMQRFVNAESGFSYRQSFFKQNPKWIITRVYCELKRIQFDISNSLTEETIAEREKRHLQNVQAAGSFFMNPVVSLEIQKLFEIEKGTLSREGRVPAGWLIEKAGLKGMQVGNAIASVQHPNYIVNTGGASSDDVLQLAKKIEDSVLNKFGVLLEKEAITLSNVA